MPAPAETLPAPALPEPATLARLPRAQRGAACRPFLDGTRAAIAARHRDGEDGVATCHAFADAIDAIVRALHEAALLTPEGAGAARGIRVALLAVGGYGRRELCPYSDLDLWFLFEDGVSAEQLAPLAEELLYPLWDLRLEVGHAARGLGDAIEQARVDLTAATALLDLRVLAGDAGLAAELHAEGRRRLFDRDPWQVVARLGEERAARHRKFGDTVFLLEPDVKNGEGGYRDLLTSLWAAKARFDVGDFDGLLAAGQATARQVLALDAARAFFLRLRTAAHLHARRRQDRLTFEIQEAIAPGLVGDHARSPAAAGVEPAVAPSVEALLQDYYRHAKAVRREGGRVLERAAERPPRRLPSGPTRPRAPRVLDGFVHWEGTLTTQGPEVFRDRPAEMVRIFRVALASDLTVNGHTRELIAEQCAREDTPARLAEDPRAAEDFLALLCDPRDHGSPSVLEQMHDLGLLTALLPEFGPCTGRVQHDLYHVFTVDQHSLYAVARLKALARGELEDALPTPTRAMRDLGETTARARLPLHLGTLLHDVGKPLGKAHSETGARLASGIAARLRLDPQAAARTELLVRQHLLLAHISQRRDLNDTAMIAHLADQLGDEETLRQLYLLTVADMSMVAPENLSSWKEQLLRELYLKTLAHFRRGPDLAGVDRSESVASNKTRAAELLGKGPSEPDLVAWFAGLPDRYFAATTPRAIARHVELSRERRGSGGPLAPVALDLSHRARRGLTELTVVADDAPGLLSRIAGVLLAARLDVLSARIASRRTAPGEPASEAIDVFTVRDRHGRPLGDDAEAARQRLERDLAAAITGRIDVEALVQERRPRGALPTRVMPAVPTEIEVDNEVSTDFTVVDVYTQDRPGVLYAITGTLARLGLDIHLSKVSTEANRVADVFYVRTGAPAADGKVGDAAAGKLDGDAIERLRDALLAALAAVPVAP